MIQCIECHRVDKTLDALKQTNLRGSVLWAQILSQPTEHIEWVEADAAEREEPYDGLQHRFGDPDEGGGERGAKGGAEKLRVRQEGAGEHEKSEQGKEAGG